MSTRVRAIEVDEHTADVLEARAKLREMTVAELLTTLVLLDDPLPPGLEAMRASGEGPWSPDALAEDVRRFAEFERTGEAVPMKDVVAWVESWGTAQELPQPQPRKVR